VWATFPPARRNILNPWARDSLIAALPLQFA
jgi:hypothetical protein